MKLFVVSDIHSYYTLFKTKLDELGFEINNPNHLLISCGDLFDRGAESKQLLDFMESVNNKVLIRGNHEDLMLEVFDKGYCEYHDFSNGTFDTLQQLAEMQITRTNQYPVAINKIYDRFKHYVDSCVNYFETKNYIFVHGWIPCGFDGSPTHHRYGRTYTYKKDWRECHASDWVDARWVNGMDAQMNGIVEPDKTIVCGHWHTSFGHAQKDDTSEFGVDACFDPFYAEGIIAIDACTVHSTQVNIIVLEDDLLQ